MIEVHEHDPNLLIETNIDKPDIRFFDIRRPPFDVYGFYKYETEPEFHRLPTDVAAATSAGVAYNEREPAGGRVRFSTDSPYIAISVEYIHIGRSSYTTLEATGGFDLYEDFPNGISESRFLKAFPPPYSTDKKYEQVVNLRDPKKRYFTINFPIHSVVKNVYIGIAESSYLGGGAKYRNRLPVVVYGSSIVHGTGPSRPGLTYTNILSRRLNLDILNLGFSGDAKAEQAIVDYMGELPMSIFVCDYDYNAPDAEYLLKTHKAMYDSFREHQPLTPYIMISEPDAAGSRSAPGRRDVIIDTFRHARELGDKNAYYIDGETFFLGRDEGDCTIDGTHPNDLGNSLMADGIERVLRKILAEGNYLE